LFLERLETKLPREITGEYFRTSLQHLLLGNEVIQESHIAMCQYFLLPKGRSVKAESSKQGFLASHTGTNFFCGEQQFVEWLPATGQCSFAKILTVF
uniref:Cyclic nucleotide-binding domain-containing protein n=1 Tax=Gongylonema pulchrum TaxID=637853 RepID=A0A183D7Q9_9BILA